MVAQRRYDRARRLVAEGLDRQVAREVIAELEPTLGVDSNFKACVHRLLAQAYTVLEEQDRAFEHLEKTLEYLYDPTERHYHDRRITEDFEMPVEDLMSEVHAEIANIHFLNGRYREAMRHAEEATKLHRFNLTGYYLWGASLLQLGLPRREAFDVFMRALPYDKAGVIEGWAEELLPEYLEEVRMRMR
jgi:tetratricopeptide (TPR) repeat protein